MRAGAPGAPIRTGCAMNIAIAVHSRTGNTRSVAMRLKQTLEASGHTVRIFDVGASGSPARDDEDRSSDGAASLAGFEGIVFGSPVHAFSLSPDMTAFMETLPSMEGKTVACFVTQAFPFAWMGGFRTLRQMAALCTARGAAVKAGCVVNWGRTCREKLISRAVERMASLF